VTATANEPLRIARLHHDKHGRPVPWFVAWLDPDGQPANAGAPGAVPDFRVLKPGAVGIAWASRICWVCGLVFQRQEPRAFTIGPMCIVNLVSAEPPAHHDCAAYSAKVCPFLSTPNMTRRTRHLPPGTSLPPGEMITRNPGVAAVWVVKYNQPKAEREADGLLFRVGRPPLWVEWYAQGRTATRREVLDSILSGMPLLAEQCHGDEAALLELDRAHAEAMAVVPR